MFNYDTYKSLVPQPILFNVLQLRYLRFKYPLPNYQIIKNNYDTYKSIIIKQLQFDTIIISIYDLHLDYGC